MQSKIKKANTLSSMPCTTYPHPTMYISCWQSLLNFRFYYMCVILCFIGRVNQSPCVGLSCNHTQDQRPRPRTQGSRPRTAFPRTDLLEAKDRNARGQGPRTQTHVFSKKRSSKKFFRQSPTYRRS